MKDYQTIALMAAILYTENGLTQLQAEEMAIEMFDKFKGLYPELPQIEHRN